MQYLGKLLPVLDVYATTDNDAIKSSCRAALSPFVKRMVKELEAIEVGYKSEFNKAISAAVDNDTDGKATDEQPTGDPVQQQVYDDLAKEGVKVGTANNTPKDKPKDKSKSDNPLVVLDKLKKDGPNPVFKGSLAHLVHLGEGAARYVAGLDDGSVKEYPTRTSMVDKKNLVKAAKEGVNRDFMNLVIDNMINEAPEKKDDPEITKFLGSDKGNTVLKKMLAAIPDGKNLLQLMSRVGYDKQLLNDMKTIANACK